MFNFYPNTLFSSIQLKYLYYTCAILYVLWDMRNRYVFVSWALGLNPKWDMLSCPRLTCIKDRKEIDIKIRDKTIDKKECFFYGFYWRRQHDFFELVRINKRVTLILVCDKVSFLKLVYMKRLLIWCGYKIC